MSEQKRDLTIDIVRGLAIVTMVGANMGPVLEEPHSFFFRLYGSFAAPVFVTLAGMMVALNYHKALDGSSRLGAYLKRGVSLLFLGSFVDAVGWKILPFMSADVLYLIGISLPLLAGVPQVPIGLDQSGSFIRCPFDPSNTSGTGSGTSVSRVVEMQMALARIIY